MVYCRIDKDWINKDHPYAQAHPNILKDGINYPAKDMPSTLDLQEITRWYSGKYSYVRVKSRLKVLEL